jgi:hypothetical protein
MADEHGSIQQKWKTQWKDSSIPSKTSLLDSLKPLSHGEKMSACAELGRANREDASLPELLSQLRTHPAPKDPGLSNEVEHDLEEVLPPQKRNVSKHYNEVS